MLRTALKPRWLVVLALALLAATVMARLGDWQFQRARENRRQETIEAKASRPAVPLTELLKPRQSFTNGAADRPVTTSGTWDGGHQVLVARRYLSGRQGLWVLTPLRLPDGSAVAVVRGWTASPDDPAVAPSALPAGTVQLAGVLRPSEPPLDRPPGSGTGLPAGQLPGVDLTRLVQLWPYKLITGYVVATAQQPGPTGAGAGLATVPPTAPGTQELAWQNLSYAIQWFVFAGFGIFMWWRLVRDDHQGRLPAAGAGAGPPPTGGGSSSAGGGSTQPGVAAGTAGDTDATGSGAGTSTATEPLSERGAHP